VHSADITFVILTKDEAADIAACLRSLPAGSRALVYDAQSADDTTEIARSLGADVAVAPWQGFAPAREEAAAQVNTAWTFMIDADERITPELAAELERLEPPSAVVAYCVARRNWFCGRWIKSAGWWPDRLVRLFRTGQARISATADVHETWTPLGASAQIGAPLDHHSYESVAEYRRKFARYTDLEAQTQDCGLAGVAAAWLVMPLRAIWFLVRRGGVLEGWRGAYVSVASALYPAVVATKRWRRPRTVP
jgi:glycosyltransferase involved in cell wall biosynthesis